VIQFLLSCPRNQPDHHGGQWVLRRVGSNGVVSVDNQMFSVGDAYKKALVDIFVDDTTIQVWSQNHLIKTVARVRKGAVRGSGLMASMSNIRRSQTVEHQWNLTTTHSHFPKSEAISSSQLLGMEWWNDTISTRTPAISMWFRARETLTSDASLTRPRPMGRPCARPAGLPAVCPPAAADPR
jgi:hypothetical protein